MAHRSAGFPDALLDLTQPPIGHPADRPLARLDQFSEQRGLGIDLGTVRLILHGWKGSVVGYVNRCPHVGTPLDLLPGRILAADGLHFICATHSALFEPASGLCVKGPCVGRRLQPVSLTVRNALVFALPLS